MADISCWGSTCVHMLLWKFGIVLLQYLGIWSRFSKATIGQILPVINGNFLRSNDRPLRNLRQQILAFELLYFQAASQGNAHAANQGSSMEAWPVIHQGLRLNGHYICICIGIEPLVLLSPANCVLLVGKCGYKHHPLSFHAGLIFIPVQMKHDRSPKIMIAELIRVIVAFGYEPNGMSVVSHHSVGVHPV